VVVLDENQRFKNILDPVDPLVQVASELFTLPDVKVLLLSATPNKMYTPSWEQEEDHYRDFFNTAQFLLEDQPQELEALRAAVEVFRLALLRSQAGSQSELAGARETIERALRG
jgi:hypothetical protein